MSGISGIDPSLLASFTTTMESLESSVFAAFPWLIFIQRWIKKHSSFYMRAVLLTFGAAIFLSRQLKGYLGSLIREYMMSRAEVKEGDDVYWMLLSWVSEQRFAKTARNFLATVENEKKSHMEMYYGPRTQNNLDDNKVSALKFTPSNGLYPFWHNGNLFFFERQFDKRTPSVARNDQLSISCFGRNPKSLKKLLHECREAFNKKDAGKTIIYQPTIKYSEGTWVRGLARTKRDIETVVMDAETKKSILKDLSKYFDTKEQRWYAARGIPYRRGYLFFGPPGSGKSSLTVALAGYFNLKVYVVNLNGTKLDEDLLTKLFGLLPAKCIVLMEDIDAAGIAKKRTASSESRRDSPKISLSGLLNIIDGVASQEGRVLIMTTNHIESLDAALIRPGRVDMMIEFRNADEAQLVQIFQGIFSRPSQHQNGELPSEISHGRIGSENDASKNTYAERISVLANEFAAKIPTGTFSPAEIQGYLLRWKDEPETAVEKAAEWVVESLAAKEAMAAAALKEEEAENEKESKVQSKTFQRMLLQTQAIHQINQSMMEKSKAANEADNIDTNGKSASGTSEDDVEAVANQADGLQPVANNPKPDSNASEDDSRKRESPIDGQRQGNGGSET